MNWPDPHSLSTAALSTRVERTSVMIQVQTSESPLNTPLLKRYYSDLVKSYLDLSLHRDAEQRDEVHDQDRPEDWDVETVKESANCCYHRRLGNRVPELKLWQPSDERTELLVCTSWQLWPSVICTYI